MVPCPWLAAHQHWGQLSALHDMAVFLPLLCKSPPGILHPGRVTPLPVLFFQHGQISRAGLSLAEGASRLKEICSFSLKLLSISFFACLILFYGTPFAFPQQPQALHPHLTQPPAHSSLPLAQPRPFPAKGAAPQAAGTLCPMGGARGGRLPPRPHPLLDSSLELWPRPPRWRLNQSGRSRQSRR